MVYCNCHGKGVWYENIPSGNLVAGFHIFEEKFGAKMLKLLQKDTRLRQIEWRARSFPLNWFLDKNISRLNGKCMDNAIRESFPCFCFLAFSMDILKPWGQLTPTLDIDHSTK
jgi:hypothetical protein